MKISQSKIIEYLIPILSCLRAQYLSYQTSHWESKGRTAYQDHLLFERLYESVEDEIDQLAEKIAGLTSSDNVNLSNVKDVYSYTSDWEETTEHLQRGLESEYQLQELLQLAMEELQASNSITLGIEDWLAATASNHETNIYLLKQAMYPRRLNPRRNPRRNNPTVSTLGVVALGYFASKIIK